MDDEISNLYKGLRLIEEEQQSVNISEEDVLVSKEKSRKCLIALVESKKDINKGGFKATMAKVWKVEGSLIFKDVGKNKFLIEFKDPDEKHKVMQGRPWSFDRNLNLICLQDCFGCLNLQDINFTLDPFWIQLHNLPFTGMNKKTGEKLVSTIGQVMLVDVDDQGMGCGQYMRVKVLVDTIKPFPRGRFLNKG
ncbi:uncharacterized protein LOC122316198 [Carya illinoinensis]|uniref:uncharacterized protein LOC122316198 n=1 Tax=Carya illinoinensis TaxID=32201 RepID=UPI001C719AF6|nr:uncharacterized protein LOC122316198 [Carya illinoinensis]